jgi:crossover junction endodeoxyribonuclease RuvC
MFVLGIDPGLAITGYGLIRENEQHEIHPVCYGAIRTAGGLALEQRLARLYSEIKRILILHKPESAAVEKLFFQKNVTTAISVGQARGVILLALAEQNITVSEYSPREVKQAVTGFGGAGKPQVQDMVRTLLSLEQTPKPDDVADALAVAICHLHSSSVAALIHDQ